LRWLCRPRRTSRHHFPPNPDATCSNSCRAVCAFVVLCVHDTRDMHAYLVFLLNFHIVMSFNSTFNILYMQHFKRVDTK
jgi:hypothetical protein